MIYIHVPFCRSFCTYCGFYSEICQEFEPYGKALIKEIDSRREEIEESSGVNTLYIGGGTPSVLPPSVLKDIVCALGASDYEEFTVEVNPDDVTPSYASFLKELGVNRISMGVQSFDDSILKWMNRRHDAASALAAFKTLRLAGFDNISIDLIFGLSQLSDDVWKATLEQALELSPEHISAYQLSIEEGSVLEELVSNGRYSPAPDELCAHQYDMLCKALSDAGYNHYEISNFAIPGREAVHNSAYWRQLPYVGLGPGAHSLRILNDGSLKRSWNPSDIKAYCSLCLSDSGFEILSPEQVALERIMLGLRTSEGVSCGFLKENSLPGALDRLLSEGFLEKTPSDNVRIPEKHFFVSDSIIGSWYRKYYKSTI